MTRLCRLHLAIYRRLLIITALGLLPLGSVDAATQAGQSSNHAPTAIDVTATSLARANEDWTVLTTIILKAIDSDSGHWRFSLVHPASLTENKSPRFTCPDPKNPAQDLLNTSVDQLTLTCRYQPAVGFSGLETFQYVVEDDGNPAGTPSNKALSQPATVAIQVKSQGLRWELTTAAGTAITSDNPSTEFPDVFGGTLPDVLFSLDWEIADPRITKSSLTKHSLPTLGALRSGFAPVPVPSITRNTHFVLQTGVTSNPQAVATSAVAAPSPSQASTSADTTGMAVTSARTFTMSGEINANAVLAANDGDSYVEFGVTGKGAIDAALGDATTAQQVAGQLIQLVRANGSATYRAFGGFRASLKQYHDVLHTAVIHGDDQISFPKNSDNLVTFEFLLGHDTALQHLSTMGPTEDRYVIRVLALPEIPGIAAHPKGMIGLELNGDLRGHSPKQIRILYGTNLSALGLGQ
jgi:hypothetical protein